MASAPTVPTSTSHVTAGLFPAVSPLMGALFSKILEVTGKMPYAHFESGALEQSQLRRTNRSVVAGLQRGRHLQAGPPVFSLHLDRDRCGDGASVTTVWGLPIPLLETRKQVV